MKIMSYSYKLLLCALLLLTANSLKAIEGFSLIPAGAFIMGDSLDGDSNAPTRMVTLDAYYMGKYEVTKAEWDEVRTWGLSNGYTDLAAGAGKAGDHPVHSISWYMMVKWCNARSQKEGLTPVYYTNEAQTTLYKTGNINITNAQVKWNANGYRLPTEAEWEKAARGGLSGKRFPWGNTISHTQANYKSSSTNPYDLSGPVNNFHPSYSAGTSPVGSFAANDYGLHDMMGNVGEWCWDWYENYSLGSQINPRGSSLGVCRVLRGGGWSGFYFSRNAIRDGGNGIPNNAYSDVGFRVAFSAVDADSDSDGLVDSVETNTGVWVSASNTGTNPNNADTDADGVPDGLEVKEKTSPVDAAKFNSFSKGLVAYYPFSGNANDESGNGHDIPEESLVYSDDRDSQKNMSLALANSFSSSNPIFLNSNAPRTFSQWVKVVEFPNTTAHMWIKPNAPYFAYPSSVIIGNGFAADGEWWMDTGSGVAFYGWGTTTNWAHMVVVYEGDVTQAKVYRDGVQIPLKRWVFDQTAFASGDYNTLHFSTTTWKPDNFSTNNLIDDVRVYDRALSPAEVGQLYQTESGNLDSDGDGLKDSVETNTGIWVSNSNTGTNPNKADTDGDGVLDGLEVQQGTDPTKDDRLKWKKVATEVNRADLLRTTEGVFHTNNCYSADGVNWQTTTYPPHSYWINASGYGGGTFVLTGAVGQIWTSNNFENWTARNPGGEDITDVVYGNGIFIARKFWNTAGLWVSTNQGQTWTSASTGSVPDRGRYNMIAFGNGTFVRPAETGVKISTDGFNWSTITPTNKPAQFSFQERICYVPSAGFTLARKVAESDGEVTIITATSADGKEWSFTEARVRTNNTGDINLSGFAGDLLFACAYDSSKDLTEVWCSTNRGQSWQLVETGPWNSSDNDYASFCSNGTILAVGTGSEIHTMELDEFKNHLNDSSPRFQIIEGSFTWHEAKADAESRGGRLAVLDTEEKIQIVDKLIAESGFLGTWVGLTDEANEGDWRWINGQIVTANRWAQGQPDLEGSEDHAGYDYTSLHKGWHDMPSGWGLRYVLEDPLLHTLNTSPVLNGAITGSGEYEPGATATITATPNAGYIFSGWTGDASGTDNPLSLTMDADKVIGATFEQDIADADSDGLSNYDEIVTYGSDPKNPDSDGDFLGDGFEVNNSSDPNVKTESQAYGLKIKSITKPSSFGNISNAKEIQLEGHTLAAWESSGNGNIHLFNFSEGKLTYQSSIASPDTSHDWPAFGAQMSLIGDRLVTGDPITWISGIHDGRGYQYNIQDRQNPQFEHRLDRDAQTATYIGGYVLAVNGFSILSSSGWSDFGTQNKVHIFRENGEFYQTWTDGYNKLIEFARSPSGDAFIVSRTESSSAPAAQATKIDIYNVTDGNIQHHGGPQLTFQFSYNDFSSINESGNQHSNHRFAFDGNKIYAIDDDYLRIFSLDDGTWNETSVDLRIYSGGSKFSSTNLLLGDGFLIVSSPNADCRDSSKGCVVIFDINSANGALRYRETITNSSQIPGEFGSYVALDEKTGHLLVSTEFGSSHAWGVINSNDGNWIVYEGLKEKQSTFQIIEGSFTWHEAKADAEARGGRLAVLDTQEKIDQANAYLGGYDYWPDMWIGLTDEAQEGSWKWIDGSPLSSTNWYPGEPNDMYGEDFAILYRNLPGVHSNGEWNDVGDSFRTAYLLEHSQVENFDTDSDGYADAEEIQWGSNPNDSGSYPQVYVSFSSNGGGNIEATGLDYGNGWGNYWYNYYEGYAPLRSIVTLTPVAYNGYVFTGWFGDASGTSSPLNLQMDSSKSVQANFEPDYADTDGDGLTNYEELAIYITNPNASDTDDDGHSDAKEIQRGSDPNNSASIPEKLGNYIGSFDSISNKVYGGSSFLINLPAASSGLPVVVSVKSGPAKVEGNRVRLTGAGIVVLAANQPGDEDYKAANEVTVSFAVLDLQNMTGEYIGNFNAEYFEGAQEAMNRNGQLSMKLAKDGAFTGSMVILGSRISIRGKFDAYGAAEISVSSKTISGVFVDLSIEPMTETEFQVAASIRWSDETSSEFVCYPVAYTGTGGTNNCTLAGKQINSLLISQLLSGIDFGHGFTKIKISTNGTLTFAGRMADGSTVTGSSRLVKDEYGDLLAQASLPLAAVKGLLHGVAQVQTDPEEGQYHLASPYEWVWVRLPQSRARIFKEGFAEKLSVYGQVWNYTKGQSALPEGVDGFTFQVDPDSIVLEEPLDLWGSWPSSNKPTWDYMPKGFTFKVNPITGDISGTAPRTINGKATKAATYQGLLLRPGLETYDGSPLLGGGYILGAESSGVVELTVP